MLTYEYKFRIPALPPLGEFRAMLVIRHGPTVGEFDAPFSNLVSDLN